MNDKEKIVQYLNHKGFSKNSFYVKTGLSIGFLDSGTSLGVDKLRIIIDNYHDLNPQWFFDDQEPMILDAENEYHLAEEPRPSYSEPNTLIKLMIEKDKQLKEVNEEIGRLKEIIRRFSKTDKNITDVSL